MAVPSLRETSCHCDNGHSLARTRHRVRRRTDDSRRSGRPFFALILWSCGDSFRKRHRCAHRAAKSWFVRCDQTTTSPRRPGCDMTRSRSQRHRRDCRLRGGSPRSYWMCPRIVASRDNSHSQYLRVRPATEIPSGRDRKMVRRSTRFRYDNYCTAHQAALHVDHLPDDRTNNRSRVMPRTQARHDNHYRRRSGGNRSE